MFSYRSSSTFIFHIICYLTLFVSLHLVFCFWPRWTQSLRPMKNCWRMTTEHMYVCCQDYHHSVVYLMHCYYFVVRSCAVVVGVLLFGHFVCLNGSCFFLYVIYLSIVLHSFFFLISLWVFFQSVRLCLVLRCEFVFPAFSSCVLYCSTALLLVNGYL